MVAGIGFICVWLPCRWQVQGVCSALALACCHRHPRRITRLIAEFHYYTDRERGVAWQVPLLTLLQTRFPLVP